MATEWFYKIGNVEKGPLGSNELKTLASRGGIGPDDLVRKGRDGHWTKAAKIQGLFAAPMLPMPVAGHPSPAAPAAPALPPSPTRIEIKAIYTQPAGVAAPAPAAPQPAQVPFAGHPIQAAPAWPQPGQAQPVLPQYGQPPAYHQAPQAYPVQQPAPAPWAYPQQPQPQPQSQPVVIHNTIVNQQVAYVARSGKSVFLAILLAAFFGPLGMLYSTVTGALVIFLVNVVLIVPTLGGIILITWPLGIVWAGVAASK